MLDQLKNIPIDQYIAEYATSTPTKTAINFYGQEISYSKLNDEINKFANYLQSIHIQKGDTIALYLQNSPQYIIAFYGAQRIGATVGPCNPMFKEWELHYQLNDLQAKVIVTSPDLYPIFLKIDSETTIEHKILINYADYLPSVPYPNFPEKIDASSFENAILWYDIMNNNAFHQAVQRAEVDLFEDVGLIVYTSGTTGAPKGAMLTFKNSEYQATAVAKNFNYRKEDNIISIMPIFHIAGKLVGMMSPFITGSTVILLTRFEPVGYLQALEKYKASILYTTTPMNIQMMNEEKIKDTDFSSLVINIVTSFGIQLTKEISDKWESFTGIPLMEFAYGMSETHTGNTMTPPDNIKYGANGKPPEGTEIKIVNTDNYAEELSANVQGMILVKGPSVFKGYKGKDEETKKSFYDGFFLTGDMGMIDDDGFLYFLGRAKEMIKCSGYSVYPEEVEKMLAKHEKIDEVAVIGIPDAVRGESVKAFIVLKDGVEATEQEMIAWAKERMSAYKYPREVEFIDAVPKTNSGKLLRRLLRKDTEKAK
ncbi:class I adenylate-forming enzyme family protein [Solibacillus silvestris]|uniref:class I adenylate-forming enzyme family protein n=1 Tax=Solibacillus silvestris TaxID=76853 RepID=UPI003F7DE649